MSVNGGGGFNATTIGSIKPWDTLTPSNKYQFWLRGHADAGDGVPVDYSNAGANGELGASVVDADFWANAGYMTTTTGVNGTNKYFAVPVEKITWDMNAATPQSFILSFRVQVDANPMTTQDGIAGTEGGGGAGFALRAVGGGAADWLAIRFSDGTTTTANLLPTDNSLADTTEHHIVYAVDGPSSTLYGWIDGVSLGAGVDLSSLTNSTQPTADMFFGKDASGTALEWGLNWADIHFLVLDTGLPSTIDAIVQKLYSRPYHPLTTEDI